VTTALALRESLANLDEVLIGNVTIRENNFRTAKTSFFLGFFRGERPLSGGEENSAAFCGWTGVLVRLMWQAVGNPGPTLGGLTIRLGT
jgi:hypothetical protein